MNEGLEFIEKPATKLKTSRNPPSSVAASSSMASSSGVPTTGIDLSQPATALANVNVSMYLKTKRYVA